MSKIWGFTLITLLTVVVISCQSEIGSQTETVVHRSDSLLYSEINDDLRWVIVQADPWSQESRLWIVSQQDVCCPSRSPDGSQIAYFVREESEVWSLWIADSDGQNAMQISEPYLYHSTGGIGAEWSFDGQYIAFRARYDADSVIVYVLDAVTGQVTTAVPGLDFDWSRTTNQLVVYEGQSASRLDVIDIPSGTAHWLLNVYLPNHYGALDWMPNRQTIVFSTPVDQEVTNPSGIYAIDADGSNLHELTRDTAQFADRDISDVQVSPNGKFVLFGSSFYTEEGVGGSGLMVLDLDNGEVRHLASGVTGPVTWSPDSKYIAFGSTEDAEGNKVENWELFLVGLDDGSITQLTYSGAAPHGLAW